MLCSDVVGVIIRPLSLVDSLSFLITSHEYYDHVPNLKLILKSKYKELKDTITPFLNLPYYNPMGFRNHKTCFEFKLDEKITVIVKYVGQYDNRGYIDKNKIIILMNASRLGYYSSPDYFTIGEYNGSVYICKTSKRQYKIEWTTMEGVNFTTFNNIYYKPPSWDVLHRYVSYPEIRYSLETLISIITNEEYFKRKM